MKKLLNTLYISQENRYLVLDGENVVVKEDNTEIGRVPLHNLEAIITCGYSGASSPLMAACAERNITFCQLSQTGKFMFRVTGEKHGNVILRKTQFEASMDSNKSLEIAKCFITGKLFNSRWVLERSKRDYPLRVDIEQFSNISIAIKERIKKVSAVTDSKVLLGLEGEAGKLYFSLFNDMILQQKKDFIFVERNRRPPLDNVNAMLSFAYTLLATMCASALEAVGLDSFVGFFHKDRSGRKSLALDLMEELRSVFADRFVLSLINTETTKFTLIETG